MCALCVRNGAVVDDDINDILPHCYYFVGRIKNIIVKGGGNIAPAEVEDAINAHPGVKMSGVVGIPDEILGQIVHALVVVERDGGEPGHTEDELRQFVGRKLSAFEVPDRWTFVESLPLTSIEKIDRKVLAELARKTHRTGK